MKLQTAVSALWPARIGLRLAFVAAFGLMVQSATAITIPEAVDATNLVWTTGGNVVWGAQASITHDGVDAAQSGAIGDSQSTYLQTTIVGPGKLTFWWKVSSEDYLIPNTWYDFLYFTIMAVCSRGLVGR